MLKKMTTLLLISHTPLALSNNDVLLEGSLNAIAQLPSTPLIKPSATLSGDLNIHYQYNEKLKILSHLEINTTRQQNGMASILEASNADGGTAIDSQGNGRVQLSELFIQWQASTSQTLRLGLLDPSTNLDTSKIANSQDTQFITTQFVNNPTIDFPSYTFSGELLTQFTPQISSTLLLASANGLTDDTSHDYEHVINIQTHGNGAFIAGELKFTPNTRQTYSIGTWLNTKHHTALNNDTKTHLSTYGLYGVADYTIGNQTLEARLGYADSKATAINKFASLAYQKTFTHWTWGTAYGYSFKSKNLPNSQPQHNAQNIETYINFNILPGLQLSPSLQYIRAPIYDATQPKLPTEIISFNVRIYYAF